MSFLSKKKVLFKDIVPKGYIDIHSHLLPSIDDGVKTIYQSAYILEEFEKMGFQKVITTPHIMQNVWQNTTQTICGKLQEVKKAIHILGINTIQIAASAEYMMDDLLFNRLKNNDILPLHEKYLLVEMSTFGPPINLKEFIFEIKLAGLTPILAHPERYLFYEKDFEKYKELKKMGFLFQVNLLSLSGFYGSKIKSLAKKLIDHNYIDFTGTDIHNYDQLDTLQCGLEPYLAKKVNELMKKNSCFL